MNKAIEIAETIGNYFGKYYVETTEEGVKYCIDNGDRIYKYDTILELFLDWIDFLKENQTSIGEGNSWEKEIQFIEEYLKTEPYLTKEMIAEAYHQGIIKLIESPNNDGIVCLIGEHWFYFGGQTVEKYDTVEYYEMAIPEETIISEIFETLEEFKRRDVFREEYFYYYFYLLEQLQSEGEKCSSKRKQAQEYVELIKKNYANNNLDKALDFWYKLHDLFLSDEYETNKARMLNISMLHEFSSQIDDETVFAVTDYGKKKYSI